MSGPSIVLPTRGLYDKKFRYRNAANTDVAETFKRVRRQQALALAKRGADAQQSLDLDSNVVPLVARGAK